MDARRVDQNKPIAQHRTIDRHLNLRNAVTSFAFTVKNGEGVPLAQGTGGEATIGVAHAHLFLDTEHHMCDMAGSRYQFRRQDAAAKKGIDER